MFDNIVPPKLYPLARFSLLLSVAGETDAAVKNWDGLEALPHPPIGTIGDSVGFAGEGVFPLLKVSTYL